METIDEEVTKEAIRFMGEAKKADKTTVMYSTDNGAEKLSWPDGGTSPFAGPASSSPARFSTTSSPIPSGCWRVLNRDLRGTARVKEVASAARGVFGS